MKNMKVERRNKLIISIFNKCRRCFDFDEYKLSMKVLSEVLKVEKINIDISVNISIVGSKKIRILNKESRKNDKVTDVLSFPNITFKKPSDINSIIHNKKEKSIAYDYVTNSYFLGDIVICNNKVIEQSKKYNHSIKREYSFLITHSMLHLLGYDHMIKKDEDLMIKKQENILNNLKISR